MCLVCRKSRDRGAAHLAGKWVLLADLFEIINDLQWLAGGVLGGSEGSKNPARWPGLMVILQC